MTQSYTLYMYKQDRRTKSGERAVLTRVFTDQTDDQMQSMVTGLYAKFSFTQYRIEYHPTMVTVKNLMTGADVEIDRDTPWCCNPASETYWSA
jgi:hypothetical protein